MNLRPHYVGLVVFCIICSGIFFLSNKTRKVPDFAYFSDKNFLVIAHRGGLGLRPENTIRAFRYADSINVDVLEMDIHSSADSHLVVIHDATVDRTTNGNGKIEDLTFNQLQSLDAAYHWKDEFGNYSLRDSNVRIPLFEEVLTSFAHRRMLVEIKVNSPWVAQELCRTLEKFGMEKKTVVASFHSDALSEFADVCQQTPISATSTEVGFFTILHLLRLDFIYPQIPPAFQVPEKLGPLHLVDSRFLQQIQSRNAVVHIWTVNEMERMEKLIKLGVDGIITDYPDRLLQVLGRKPNLVSE